MARSDDRDAQRDEKMCLRITHRTKSRLDWEKLDTIHDLPHSNLQRVAAAKGAGGTGDDQ